MKAKGTKELVRAELTKAITEQFNEHTREIAAATADRVLEIWREFRRGHAKVLELAERDGAFRAYVDTLKPSDLVRLDEVVVLVLAGEGEAGIANRLRDGSLDEAVTRLSPAAMAIARETRSLEQALLWAGVAGASLPQVTELGLYRRGKAQDYTGPQLQRILALDDRTAIVRLAAIGRIARENLLELPDRELKSLARALSEAELETLARYLTDLEKPARERVLHAVAASPARMQVLAPARVRDAILTSSDQLAAVTMMLRADSGFDIPALKDDFSLVYDGRVNPVLLWDRHPAAIAAAALAALVLLLMLRRLLFGRRGRAVRPTA
jgi:hypothetical protein